MGIYNGYKFHPLVVLRTPRKPLFTEVNEKIVIDFFKEFPNQEAIFLASPQLYNRLISKQIDGFTTSKEDRKLLQALTKYFIRSHSRATPFGLFAGLSVLPWGCNTSIKLNQKIERHTRLDMSLLCMLANKLISISKIAERLTFYKNTSLYKINSDFRYVEYLYQKSRRIHQISSIKADKYLNKTLKFISKKGAKFNEIANNLIDIEVNEEIAKDFVFQLIQNQILYSELEPEISGREYIFQILEVLHSINEDNDAEISFFIFTLEEINKQIEFLDQSIENKVDRYHKILDLIKSLELDFDENTMFQTDMVALLEPECQIAESHQKTIAETIDFLQKINLNDNDQNLNQFCEKFTERYQEQEVPLTMALDIENGIGYLEKKHGDYKPLIEDITFHNHQNKTVNFTVNQQKIYKTLINANRNHTYEINLKEIDFETSHSKNMPASFNVLFKELEAGNIQIEAIGGSSAATLLGRFGYVHNQICEIIHNVINEEQSLNREVIFAEILHLPEQRTGNIIMHPRYRKYEIPFLAKSGLEGKNMIEISDLMVSVVNNQVILRSKKLNKIILPRLSNAHNYTADALPIYQFLCDIQYQNVNQYLNFDWGKIGTGFNFLPRV